MLQSFRITTCIILLLFLHLASGPALAIDDGSLREDQLYDDNNTEVVGPTDGTTGLVTEDQTDTNTSSHHRMYPSQGPFKTKKHEPGSQDLDPEVMGFLNTLQSLKERGTLIYILIAGGIIGTLLITGAVAGCFFGIMYLRKRLTMIDPVKAMEDGGTSEKQPVETKGDVEASETTSGPMGPSVHDIYKSPSFSAPPFPSGSVQDMTEASNPSPSVQHGTPYPTTSQEMTSQPSRRDRIIFDRAQHREHSRQIVMSQKSIAKMKK
ncbi:uncharacterized protein [Hyperolius riggenbachi]|uniref:uncharacterized protein n=1 Tax=Hyperolius riggenbachi TaxID=752182 RepID=UPI0035A2EFFF